MRRSRAIRWGSVVALGTLLGVSTARVDVVAGGLQQDEIWRAASMILNAGSVWAGLAVLCGWIIGRPVSGGVAGVAGLAAAVAGYYAFGALFGDRVQVGFAGLTGVIRLWALLALIVGPPLGVVGALIHRPGGLGYFAALVVPAGIMVEMLVLRRLGPDTFAVDPALAWAQAGMVAVAALAAVAATIVRLAPRLRLAT